MFCGFDARPGYQVLKRPQTEQTKIFGTWDFKWQRGRKIRVAFQLLSDKDKAEVKIPFAQLVKKVVRYANTWKDGYEEIYGIPCPVTFDFDVENLPPPAGKNANSGRSRVDSKKIVDYDVLVSLASLGFPISYEEKVAQAARNLRPATNGKPDPWPTRKIDKTPDGDPLQLVFPTAELGRYATRCDYGVPTVYLGRPPRTIEVQRNAARATEQFAASIPGLLSPLDKNLAEYFGPADGESNTTEFEATIVHEFGHVLGIPHLHQSPLDRPSWRGLDELRHIITAATGVEIDADAVRAQLILPFPSTQSSRGDVLYSDWAPLARDQNGEPQLTPAAMIHPLLQLLVVPSDPSASSPSVRRQLAPTALDLAFLHRMYTPNS